MRLDGLPAELIGEIINFIDLDDVAMLQATSRRMREICRNAVLWRDLFLGTGPEHECKHAALLRKREENAKRLARAASGSAHAETSADSAHTAAPPNNIRTRPIKLRWDPVFENEPVSWYDEYVQRYAPIAVSWFELPVRTDSLGRRVGYRIDPADVLEVCGVALYWPRGMRNGCDRTNRDDRDDTGRLSGVPPLFAVSPLADGSVCMWDVNGTAKRRGAIVQRSAPGLLFGHAQGSGSGSSSPRSQSNLFTAMESVSIDSERHLAYFAMDTVLVVVDLHTLQVVGGESFAGPVTALSAAHHSVPLTVGHDSGVCLYDPREAVSHIRGAFRQAHEVVDVPQDVLFSVHDSCRGKPHNFPLSSPLSILHMPEPGYGAAGRGREGGNEIAYSHDIFVAGRVPTIFRYDRRYMDVPKDTIFSGATLCGLSSMPYPYPKPATGYTLVASDNRESGVSGVSGVSGESEESPCYRTLMACGEYKSKGSLELYAIGGSGDQRPSFPPPEPMINRQTSSSAKILSVAAHGKRIIVSDGAGFVRWFERDGFREARRCEINGGTYAYDSYGDGEENENENENENGNGNENENGNENTEPGATETTEMTEIVRKLLPTGIPNNASTTDFSSNDVLIWTGEHLGLITFSSQPGFNMDDFVQDLQTEEERATEKKGFEYRAKMRQLFASARYFGRDSDSDD